MITSLRTGSVPFRSLRIFPVPAIAVLVVALSLAGCTESPAPSAMEEGAFDVEIAGKAEAGAAVSGKWIVTFADDVTRPRDFARQLARDFGFVPGHTYDKAMKGMSFTGSAEMAEQIRGVAGVVSVIEDLVVVPAGSITQSSATWGIDRIDQAALPLTATYTYDKTGFGVRVYVVDSGIETTHTQFGGRAFKAADFVNDGKADCTGHGTHVAGTIGSTLYGVAKKVGLYSVRILPCTGGTTMSTLIAAIDFVVGEKELYPSVPMVMNMSLSTSYSSTLNSAVERASAAGVVVTSSAGNGNGLDACNVSPASAPSAITVGATDKTDARLSLSNVGPCVDLFAPGGSILSTYIGGKTATYSGTSQAAPHVAGVAALLLQVTPNAAPADIARTITDGATTGRVLNAGTGSPNRLLNSRIGLPAPNAAPVADFTTGDPNLALTFTDRSTDSDGTIASRRWNFGDGTTSTATSPSKTYSAPGTYSVSLTVTDNEGATHTTTRQVTVHSVYISKILLKPTLSSGKYYVTATVYTKYLNKATGTFFLNGAALNTVTATSSSKHLATLKSTTVAAAAGSVFRLDIANAGSVGGVLTCQVSVGTTQATCVP